jgi:hypothetical protein
MPFLVKSRRASVEKLLAQHPGASLVAQFLGEA